MMMSTKRKQHEALAALLAGARTLRISLIRDKARLLALGYFGGEDSTTMYLSFEKKELPEAREMTDEQRSRPDGLPETDEELATFLESMSQGWETEGEGVYWYEDWYLQAEEYGVILYMNSGPPIAWHIVEA